MNSQQRIIPPSELIINDDGSIFHLHLQPSQLSSNVLLMGDPDRVTLVGSMFDTVECEVQSREFRTITGLYKGKRITAISHGIGPDNIDIVLTELDALANIDFSTRMPHKEHRTLTLVRVGTSGGLQPHCPVGSFVVANRSIGFDGVLNYYSGRDSVADSLFEDAFCKHTHWSPLHCRPYVVSADAELVERIGFDMIKGVTISAIGFYAPQGRWVRIPPAQQNLNDAIRSFSYSGETITNYEMESAPLAGLGQLMGHKAITICAIIANRYSHKVEPNYQSSIHQLIRTVLERI